MGYSNANLDLNHPIDVNDVTPEMLQRLKRVGSDGRTGGRTDRQTDNINCLSPSDVFERGHNCNPRCAGGT